MTSAQTRLRALVERRLAPLVIDVSPAGKVLAIDGERARYGLEEVGIGDDIELALPALVGMFPLGPEDLLIEWIEHADDRFMDLHLLPSDDGGGTVLVVASAVDQPTRVEMQRVGNRIALDKEQQARILGTFLGDYVVEELMHDRVSLAPEGERRQATMLFCDIRRFTPYSERHHPQEVFRTLGQYLSAIATPLIKNRGIIEKFAGDAVYAVFGIAKLDQPAPTVAVTAANEILEAARAVRESRRQAGEAALDVGIGITTGVVAVGLLGPQDRRSFSAIGHHVNLAARLQAKAKAGEVIVDSATYEAIGTPPEFIVESLELKGIRDPVIAYRRSASLTDEDQA